MASSETKRALSGALADLAVARELNRQLGAGAVSLDWSDVTSASARFLHTLVQGLEMDEVIDALGAGTMRPEVSDRVVAAFEGRLKNDAEGPTSTEVRGAALAALEADMIGPFYPADHAGPTDEALPLPPSRWYLTGFLAPQGNPETHDPTSEEELGAGSDEFEEETTGEEPQAKQKQRFPASMGLSVLLPPEGDAPDTIRVSLDFAEYVREPREEEGRRRPRIVWRRCPRDRKTVELTVTPEAIETGKMVPDTAGIWVQGKVEVAEAPGLAPGTRALSLFVVNRRSADGKPPFDEEYIFQVYLELGYAPGLVARPNRQGEHARDWDDKVADLQFRDRFEYAVGHGVSVDVPDGQDPVTVVRTTWMPRYEVRRVKTRTADEVETGMEALADLESGAAAKTALMPLVEAYSAWLDQQAQVPVDSDEREATRDSLVAKACHARDRIQRGIDRLADDPEVFDAFRMANRAMAEAALRRNPERYETSRPSWRLFQLAFVLLNLVGVADEESEERDNVELIFFPTGGGKTEAYLGVIAFTLILRRFRGQARPDKGLGVAVLLRYTLRLLTLDQLGRAATLMCALEQMRQADEERLGDERFAVGLWVGRSATANTLAQVKRAIVDYKNSPSKSAVSPFPLTNCPWCQAELNRDSLRLVPSPAKAEGVVVGCSNFRCDFSARKNRDGLPVLFVDEQIYRELPCFLVATVDKFAMLPWRGETGMLFGRAASREGTRFFGPLDGKAPKGASPLAEGLRPPELIVQDELHLISGPLGTMVGLYETAIEYLSTRTTASGAQVRPKVLASTATVRRAREQIRSLFGRPRMALFPPPGVDDSETWFATVNREEPGRLYVGVAAQGRSMKGILLRSYTTLLGAAQKRYDPKAPPQQAADPYMTVAGYFNSLRELGGMRRLVEDDVRIRCALAEGRTPHDHEGPHPWLKERKIQAEPVELTSRESTARIKQAKDRLNLPHAEKDHVDVLLASNMISVGVDIDRLGLMVVAGQPKTTSEYIQASSRVGRQHPGLVITCFNLRKPRDRSHYERFSAYHASFYRFVEATSLTPFSGPALERGLAGTLIAMARLANDAMTPAVGAMQIEANRGLAELAVNALAKRAGAHKSTGADHDRLVDNLRGRGQALLDAWETLVKDARDEGAARRSYSRFDLDKSAGNPLLYMVIDEDPPPPNTDEARFAAPTSMRDVEQQVHLWIERRSLGGRR
jgi:hypothetical protein